MLSLDRGSYNNIYRLVLGQNEYSLCADRVRYGCVSIYLWTTLGVSRLVHVHTAHKKTFSLESTHTLHTSGLRNLILSAVGKTCRWRECE